MNTEIVRYGKHESEFLELYTPNNPVSKNLPMIALYHGGFFRKEYGYTLMTPLAEDLVSLGYMVANIEYPRVGEGLMCEEMIWSVFRSFDFLRKYSNNVIAMGHSAGGYFALMLSIRKHLKGTPLETRDALIPLKVIAQAPLSDLLRGQREGLSTGGNAIKLFIDAERSVASIDIYYSQLSPNYYSAPSCTVHIVHGTNDIDVPYEHSVSFLEQYLNPGLYLHSFSGDHYDVINPTHDSWKLQKALLHIY